MPTDIIFAFYLYFRFLTFVSHLGPHERTATSYLGMGIDMLCIGVFILLFSDSDNHFQFAVICDVCILINSPVEEANATSQSSAPPDEHNS